jgi:hypothetical protein
MKMLMRTIVLSTPATMIVIRPALALVARVMPVGRLMTNRLIDFRSIAMMRH